MKYGESSKTVSVFLLNVVKNTFLFRLYGIEYSNLTQSLLFTVSLSREGLVSRVLCQ